MKKVAIIGSGLAGCLTAYQLVERGHEVTLFNSGVNHSSRIAAGLITPLVFRRMTRSWMLDESIEKLKSLYTEIELKTNSKFLHPLKMRRLFSSEQEFGYWQKKQEREDFLPYMNQLTNEDINFDQCLNDFGSGRVKSAHYVDVNTFLDKTIAYISKNGRVINSSFDFNQLSENIYQGEYFDDFIFCQGYQNSENPFFKHLPINTTKGQTIAVKANNLPENTSLNRKCFMLPLGNHTYRVGATYEWHDNTLNTTQEGLNTLLEKLRFITKEKVEVLDQKAGVRPTVIDRRPLIGTHPEHQYLHIINGLGTKGYMIAPLMTSWFINYFCDQKTLPEEVNIKRFKQDLK